MGKPDYMKYDGRNVEPPYDTEAAPSSCTVGSIVGCPVCGGKLVTIRGKHHGNPRRVVCPTCLADRMDMIRDMSDPNYGIGCAANTGVTGVTPEGRSVQ